MTSSSTALGSWRSRYRNAREKRWFRWTSDLAFVAILVTALSAWQGRHHVRGEAPAVTLRTLAGEPVSLAALAGKPVLLAFWAPWCSVCKAQSQNLSWVARLAGDHARVLSVAAAYADVREVERYVQDRGVDYPVLLGDERTTEAFHVDAFPTIYTLDAEGRVKHSAAGYTTTVGMLWRLLL
jgi:thiol-disulfide isomerase/thioredoxin